MTSSPVGPSGSTLAPSVPRPPGGDGAAPPPATGDAPALSRTDRGWHACVELPLDPRAAGVARRTARRVLEAWGVVDEGLLHDVAVVVSELVSNGVRHGGERVELELLLDAATVEVAVLDGSAVLPQPRGFEHDAEGGRGIAIVEAVSREWGVQERPEGGKRVFARLARQDGLTSRSGQPTGA